MYSILIADDEKYVRQDIIRSVNWSAHGYFIVGEASNGIQALEKIGELHPDVLITDIRMPLADGLSLIERALELQPDLRSIIISGHEDFQYAKEAIRLGVLDYLTKPIDDTSILSALRKLDTSLEKKDPQNAPASGLPLTAGPSVPAGQPARDDREKLSYAVLSFYFPSGFRHKTRKYTESLFFSWLSHATLFSVTAPDMRFSYLSSTLMQISVQAAGLTRDILLRLIRYLLEQIRACGFSSPVAVVTPPFTDHARLQTLQTSSLQLLSFHLLYGENVIWYRPAQAPNSAFLSEATTLMDRFRKDIGIRHFENTEAYLSQLLKEENAAAYTPELLEYIICETANMLRKIYLSYQLTLDPGIFKELFSSLYAMPFFDLETLRQDLVKRCKAVFSHIHSTDTAHIVPLIKQYIQKNYDQDITLVSIASEFFFNPSYLSHMFKQQTGGNLSSYIEEIRIKEALRLLRMQKLSIGQVARMVGYNDPNYFSKIFRKHTGFSPARYTGQEDRP